MNERIKELAKQANANELSYAYYRGEKKPENAVTLHSVDLEKFAELIVKECGLLADQYQFEKNTPNPLRVKRLDLVPSEFIKKHFGVEL